MTGTEDEGAAPTRVIGSEESDADALGQQLAVIGGVTEK